MSIRFQAITRSASLQLPNTYRHACQAMLFAPTDEMFLRAFKVKQIILMTMRFDGKLAFPGGFAEKKDKSLEATMNRSLPIQLGIPHGKIAFKESDYLSSSYSEKRSVCMHFYTKRISTYLLTKIEDDFKPHLHPRVLGLLRCPLYTLGDGTSGFPEYLNNNFIGNTKDLLIEGITHHNLLPENQLKEALVRHTFSDVHSLVE